MQPYHASVPTFGVWGFAFASPRPLPVDGSGHPIATVRLPTGLRFLNVQTMAGMFQMPTDLAERESEVNRLNDQVLVRYYEQEWNAY